MESQFYTRISMGGWIFLATLAAMLWSGDSPAWQEFTATLQQANADVMVLLVGALVGVSAPPALGLIFERIASVLFVLFRLNMWSYSRMRTFQAILDETLASEDVDLGNSAPASATFQAFFYTYGDGKLIDWARRRRTHGYVSFTSAIAILAGVLTGIFLFQVDPPLTIFLCVGISAVMIYHGLRENRIHRYTIEAWIQTEGVLAARSFVSKLKHDSR
mgnify:CR=1 FL=1